MGNNPILYSDPFGLSADTLDFGGDAALEQQAKACRNSNAVCRELYDALDNDTRVYKVTAANLTPPNAGSAVPDATHDPSTGMATSFTGGTIRIDQNNFGALSAAIGAPSNFNTVFVHEMGHMVGNLLLFRNGMLGADPQNQCWETCAQGAENAYRASAGLPLRP